MGTALPSPLGAALRGRQVGRFGHRAKDLAAYLDTSGVSVSRWLSEGLQLRSVDPDFRSRPRDLEREIGDRAAPPACSRAGDQG